MQNFPLITIIFILIWIFISLKVALILLGIGLLYTFWYIGKFLYRYNPRTKRYYDNNEIPPGN
jgi:hypothetical protein